jgi:hypothetical protein
MQCSLQPLGQGAEGFQRRIESHYNIVCWTLKRLNVRVYKVEWRLESIYLRLLNGARAERFRNVRGWNVPYPKRTASREIPLGVRPTSRIHHAFFIFPHSVQTIQTYLGPDHSFFHTTQKFTTPLFYFSNRKKKIISTRLILTTVAYRQRTRDRTDSSLSDQVNLTRIQHGN